MDLLSQRKIADDGRRHSSGHKLRKCDLSHKKAATMAEPTTDSLKTIRVDIWHNLLWSRYKARVFSALHERARTAGAQFRFFQISETDSDRNELSPIDRISHAYPYSLLFASSYDAIPRVRLLVRTFWLTFVLPADLVVLAGYGRPEYWGQLVAALITGKKVAAFCDSTLYDSGRNALKWVLKRIFLSACTGVFCYGQRSVEYLQALGVPRGRIWIRCQAAAFTEGYAPQHALQERIARAPDVSRPRYLFVGRLAKVKNLDILLRAFRTVLEKRPHASLAIVGAGPEEQHLRALIRVLRLEKSVEMLGSKTDQELYDEYLKASGLVLPSSREPWGLVVNEALSFGCPVVVSDHCGCVPELVVDGKTGFVVRCDDVEDLAVKMDRAVSVFSDTAKAAQECIDHIAPYSSERAALQIYYGCVEMLSQTKHEAMRA